jgi:hypothetical protein
MTTFITQQNIKRTTIHQKISQGNNETHNKLITTTLN